jgi:release factor glutamine methyltransferase
MTTVAELLRASPLPALETRILLAHVLGWSRTQLITRDTQELPAGPLAEFHALAARRAAGVPIAQLTGSREFFGLEFEVTPDVLIPRPETELLVELALAAARRLAAPRVLDLGAGSGAIGVSIAHALPHATVVATDRCAAALAVARRNAARLAGARVALHLGDWFEALPVQQFDVIVSNPPYIAASDPHLNQGDLRYEPRDALTDHADGLGAIRAIVAAAPPWLVMGGALWIEHGYDQAEAVRAIFNAHGFEAVRSERDLACIERVTGGVRPTLG